jgi:hypothetical protein
MAASEHESFACQWQRTGSDFCSIWYGKLQMNSKRVKTTISQTASQEFRATFPPFPTDRM